MNQGYGPVALLASTGRDVNGSSDAAYTATTSALCALSTERSKPEGTKDATSGEFVVSW